MTMFQVEVRVLDLPEIKEMLAATSRELVEQVLKAQAYETALERIEYHARGAAPANEIIATICAETLRPGAPLPTMDA